MFRWTIQRGLFPAAGAVAVLIAGLFGVVGKSAADTNEGLRLLDSLRQRLDQANDYQCVATSYVRRGDREQERTYRLSVKDERMVRLKIVSGPGAGSEVTRDASGRIRGRRGGLLKSFAQTMQPDDPRLRCLDGTPFWEATGEQILRNLRQAAAQPGTRCEVRPATDAPGLVTMCLCQPGAAERKVWIDPRQCCVTRLEEYQGGALVRHLTVQELHTNVGLRDDYFSF
jgi:outer membrane lipoprotein-sorting protein